ncbi:MAG: citrate/2-methylcitrate synthase [Micropepsaceae bacterium]
MTLKKRPDPRPVKNGALIDIAEATKALGVNRNTLYAYVSRGLVRSSSHPDHPKTSLYDARDIQALIERKSRMRRPRMAAATALEFGLPVLKTKLTHFEGDSLFYRNVNAIDLSRTASLEDTARLLWNTGTDNPFDGLNFDPREVPGWLETNSRFAKARATDRACALLPLLTNLPGTPAAHSASSGTRAAARLLLAVVSAATADTKVVRSPIHKHVATALSTSRASDTIRRALVLLADHELNASTFAVRVVASTGARHTNCVMSGLAALSGPRHGAATERARAFISQIGLPADAERIVGDRLDHAESIPGFGHFVYPAADPRAAELLTRFKIDSISRATLKAVRSMSGTQPNIDFALVAMERSFGLPDGTALTLFAIARTVGWLSHVFEQRAAGNLIRPRAEFVLE